jgi:hypothetical protein
MASVVVHVKLPSGRAVSVTAHPTERVGDLVARVVAAAVDDPSTPRPTAAGCAQGC